MQDHFNCGGVLIQLLNGHWRSYQVYLESPLCHLTAAKTWEGPKASMHHKVQDFFPQEDLTLCEDPEGNMWLTLIFAKETEAIDTTQI